MGGRLASHAAAAAVALLLLACQQPIQHPPHPESRESVDLLGHPSQEQPLPAHAAERQADAVQLAAPPALLSIESEPAGARARVAGKIRGVTPIAVIALEPGRVEIELELSGYAPVTLERSLEAGAHERVSVALRMQPSRARFHSLSVWETLELDGKAVALRRGEWTEVSAGSHRVIGIAGRYFALAEFAVQPGGAVTVSLQWRLRTPDPEAYVWVAGRSATIGSPQYIEMNPVRRVRFGPFWIARRETTVEEYWRCVEGGACEAPPTGEECNYDDPERAKHPVNCVNARDAERFARWLSQRDGLSYRLPTAQEWEMVARAGSSPSYESCNTCDASCDRLWRNRSRRDGWETTAPAGGLTACQGEGAIHDLVGNVSEFCADAEFGYVERGGSFSQMDTFLDPAFPSPRSADERSSSIGFRLVVESPEIEPATHSASAQR
jgi:formylglycine-generating enzyme required for sulfatase activity